MIPKILYFRHITEQWHEFHNCDWDGRDLPEDQQGPIWTKIRWMGYPMAYFPAFGIGEPK